METFFLLKQLGKTVKETRCSKKPRMSQIDFYHYLFPNDSKSDESIKKKMNAIENGHDTNLDISFLEAFISKTGYGLDYIFGIDKNYKSYDNKYLSDYFGLSEQTIIALHKIGMDKKLNLRDPVIYHSDKERRNIPNIKAQQHMDKDFANTFTLLLDFIFKDDNFQSKNSFSKEALFYLIYNYLSCDAVIKHSNTKDSAKTDYSYLVDSDNRIYHVDVNDYFLTIMRDRIHECLDELRDFYHKTDMPKIYTQRSFEYQIIDARKSKNKNPT